MNPRKRIALAVLGALAVLALSATPALAKAKDANHNKIPDKWEAKYHLSTKKNLANKDADKDGLKNGQEYRAGTNPRKADSDKDGITDAKEDTDNDGLVNVEEFRAKTNPKVKDTDKDGVLDAKEDPDADRLNNAAEYTTRTNPLKADTNSDGTDDFNTDSDNDGLDNGAEIAEGCDPWDDDSDNDGTIDGLEVAGFITNFDAETGALSVVALNDSDRTFDVTVGENTVLAWNDVLGRDDVPTLDDLKTGAIVTDAEGQVQADGSVLATSIILIPAPDTASFVATVSWYDSDEGWLGLLPSDGSDEYQAIVDDATEFAWADGVWSGHEASADDLNEGAGVTELDIKYNADGDIVAKKIVLVPSYITNGDGSGWDDGDDGGDWGDGG